MSRWIVTYIPAWVLLVVLIVLVAGGAVLIQSYVRRRFPALTGDEHNDVTKFTYGFIGFVYAFFIGFVVSSMWGQINIADGNARSEGAAAVQMARDSVVFDTADSDGIRQALLAYEQAAITEWSQAGINRSPEADTSLARLYTAYEQVQAKTDTQKTFLPTSLANLDKVSQARTVRLLTAREDAGPPWPLWAVIFLTSAMVLGTVVIYGVKKPVLHYAMVAIVGVIVATNLFLVLELAHPYIGEVSTSPDALQEVVWVLSQPAT
jgi:Flp pilus assembly protein TadB